MDNKDIELFDGLEDDDEDYVEEVVYNYDDAEDDIVVASTVPVPTYDNNNRIDYVELMKDYKSNDENRRERAAEIIIGDLTGLVLHIIKKKYSNYSRKYYDDLVQSGEIGILEGLKDYDPTKSLPATYFYSFILHEIQSFINSNVYRTTPYYSANMKKINRAIAKFENADMPYTKRDISIQTGIPLDTVEKVMGIMNGRSEVSLDTFCDQLEGPSDSNPEDEYFKKENSEYIYKVMRETLTQEEALIIIYLFGLGGVEPLSLKNIARKMNLPIDKIKKLKVTAFCKLKNSSLSKVYASRLQNDVLELEDEDAISLFPGNQAKDSANEMDEMEIDF